MAAGCGSRFGGLKQLCEVDSYGHILMDYSVFDAVRAGFDRVVIIIKRRIEDEMRSAISKRLDRWGIKVDFAYQEIDNLPKGYSLPEGRTKPWGTAHAVACLEGMINSPFALINADDYYGRSSFKSIFDLLSLKNNEWGMISYKLKNTLSSSGSVSRGICEVSDGYLRKIHEEYGIAKKNGVILSESGKELGVNTRVSMNLWGFTPKVIDECKGGFSEFLDGILWDDPTGKEYYLTDVISRVLERGDRSIRVIDSGEVWQGITNREDREVTAKRLDRMITEGKYPLDF